VRPALAALDVPLDAPGAEPRDDAQHAHDLGAGAASHSAPPLDFAAAARPPAAPGEPRGDAARRADPFRGAARRRERGAPVGLDVPAAPEDDPVPPPQASSARARHARPRRPRPRAGTSRRCGVPLASLAACRSDRDEDALKQRVVAAAESRGRCESAAGRFHFVETKNVNAFLMWIERAPGRQLGDRCSELLHALDCLAKAR
jgi:hypothetical protein